MNDRNPPLKHVKMFWSPAARGQRGMKMRFRIKVFHSKTSKNFIISTGQLCHVKVRTPYWGGMQLKFLKGNIWVCALNSQIPLCSQVCSRSSALIFPCKS